MNERKPISSRTRFDIFARDKFACRYCGRQSDVVTLHVDHVIPVCQGGTNDRENLITACQDCNLGKAGRHPEQAAPTDADRLRLAQERNEQMAAFEAARMARASRERMTQEVVNFWCECSGRESMDKSTLSVILKYVEDFGAERVFEWVEKTALRYPHFNDQRMGKYISGIRRGFLEEQGEV
jgi:hypothetical protein